MGQVIAALDVGGTSIKTGAIRFDDDAAEPRIEVGPVLPTNANASADVVLDSLARGADAALDVAGRDVSGLAIAICGPFDIDAGVSRIAASTSSRTSSVSISARPCGIGRPHRACRSDSPATPSPPALASPSLVPAPESTAC